MARKQDQEEVEEQDEEEVDDLEEDQSGISINITEDTISVDVPRDGNEGEAFGRLAKMVDALAE